MKSREDRRRTVLPARMRNGAGWTDACILNVSSRGLLIYSKSAAQPGSSIEIRRGGYLVVGQVVWRTNERIGLCTDNPLLVDDLISSEAASAAVPLLTGTVEVEQRKKPRDPDRSRARSRAMEFLSLVLIGTALAGTAAVFAQQALTVPMAAVNRALGGS